MNNHPGGGEADSEFENPDADTNEGNDQLEDSESDSTLAEVDPISIGDRMTKALTVSIKAS